MDAVSEIKSRLSIEDVVGQYIELKRSGGNFKGLSPFSNERTPSFMVSPEKQIWHDFSSGKGGDMFGFVMEMEGLDFRASLEMLARKAGVDLAQYSRGSAEQSKQKERLYQVLEVATRFYQVQFSKNRPALEYVLKKRLFSKETALAWRFGYSPNTGTALVDFLKTKGFKDQEIKEAGLSAKRSRGVGDMFRGRLMIPLADATGRVVGFTARILVDDPNAPKYINTPSTLLYDKSRHVFGLHLAKESLRQTKYVVIAEGQLDVIASHQAGVRQVVATAGTALTEHQLKSLGRFTPDVRLCFDADAAGINAAERAIPIASKVGVNLSIISIPSGKDPDDLIKQDPNKWQQIIQNPKYALDWLIERYRGQLDISSAQGKRRFSDIILKVIKGLNDQVEQEHYLEIVGQLIGVSRDALTSKFKNDKAPSTLKPRIAANQPPLDKPQVELIKTENHLLALVLCQPQLRFHLQHIKPAMLAEDQASELLTFLIDNPNYSPESSDESTPVQNRKNYVKMLLLLYEELYQNLEPIELGYEATQLEANLVKLYVKRHKLRISRELIDSGEKRSEELLGAVKKLDNLLKDVQRRQNAQSS